MIYKRKKDRTAKVQRRQGRVFAAPAATVLADRDFNFLNLAPLRLGDS
jgi:hypothetical protein